MSFSFLGLNSVGAKEDYDFAKDYEVIESEVIGYNTSIDSDFKNLKISPEFDNRNRVITFSKGYIYENDKLIDKEFVYFYSDDLDIYTTQIIEFNCYKFNSIDDDRYDKSKSYSVFASVISADENIYKAIILSDTSKIFDNSKLYFYNYIVRDENNIIVKTIEYGIECLFRSDLTNDNNNIWSCVVYDLVKVEVKGVKGYFEFDKPSKVNPFGVFTFWSSSLLDMNKIELYFAFFDVVDEGIEWDDSKTIHRIDYHITETEKEITHKCKIVLSDSNKYKILSTKTKVLSVSTYQDSVLNNDYTFTYPVSLTFDNFDEWLKNGFVVKDKVTYSGIWKTSDTRLSDNLKLSSGYDSSLLSKYTYACRIGAVSGYLKTQTIANVHSEWFTEYCDVIEHKYSLDVDFDYIYYKENGESFIISVDKTTLKDIGYIGNKEDIKTLELPFIIEENINDGFNIWNLISTILVVGLLLVLILFIFKIISFIRNIKLRSDVRRMKKRK